MADAYCFDVFVSYAAADEAIARRIWQKLRASKLRVFWSPSALKRTLGESWFDQIQSSIVASRHFLLIASPDSISSVWVTREWQAFMRCSSGDPSRRLIPLMLGEFDASQLPPFLQGLQAQRFTSMRQLSHVVDLLGGNSDQTKKSAADETERANQGLEERVRDLTAMVAALKRDFESVRKSRTSSSRGAGVEASRGKTSDRTEVKSFSPYAAQDPASVRLQDGSSFRITPPDSFAEMAMYWDYVVRNRIRWCKDEKAWRSVAKSALRTLAALGLEEDKLTEVAKAGIVQVEIPYTTGREEIGWELRVLPWEFLLTVAAAKERTSSLVVVRHLCCGTETKEAVLAPQKLMMVESIPPAFGDMYSLASERRLVESTLRPNKVMRLSNPSLEKLRASVRRGRPDIIHLAGIDSRQGEQLLRREGHTTWDGYLLADANGNPTYATSEQLAEALRGSQGHSPVLVCCNFWNSATRVAALIAAEGTTAAIGFQDEVEDRVAEDFFGKFYSNYRAADWDLLRAFGSAAREVNFGGAIPVLWSSRSLVAASNRKRRKGGRVGTKSKV